MNRLLTLSLGLSFCACSTSGSAPQGSSATTSVSAPTSTAAAIQSAQSPAPAPTGLLLEGPFPAGVAQGSNGTGRSQVIVQPVSASSRWMVLGGDEIHLCEWKPGATFRCSRIEQKLPDSGPMPTITLSGDPPFLSVQDTTYDKRGLFDPKGTLVSRFYDSNATRGADGSLAINNADNLIRYASPGPSAKASPFVYPKGYDGVQLAGDTLIYQREESGKKGLFARALRGPTEPPADEQRLGELANFNRTSSVHGCVSKEETLLLVAESLKDYSLGRGAFLQRQGDTWSAPFLLADKLPTYLEGARFACGRGALAWAAESREVVHHLSCAKGTCKTTSIQGVFAKGSLDRSVAPLGDQIAAVSVAEGAESKVVLRIAPPDGLASAPDREIGHWGKGGVWGVSLVGGSETVLLLVKPAGDPVRWVAYELSASGAVKLLGG
jgi:hypothetical protein